MRFAGLVYLAYFGLAIGGAVARNVRLQIVATAFYFILALVLYRVFGPADPLVALALFPLVLAGCAMQGVAQARANAGLLRLALAPFGLFLLVLGYLVIRSSFAPAPLGAVLALAGVLWPLVAIPRVPTWYSRIAIAIGIIAEGALAVWLIVAG